MNTLLVTGWLLLAGVAPDTTLTLQRGDRVVVENVSGTVHVRAWQQDRLALRGEGGRAVALGAVREGRRVRIGVADARRRGMDTDMELLLPAWAALEIRGREVEVEVEGMSSELEVHTVEGDITARNLNGVVTLSTVDGVIHVEDASGKIVARSRGDDVVLRRVRGEVEASTGSGDVILEDVRASAVKAETLDGDLLFQGALAKGGRYAFVVHDGDAVLRLPRDTGARARVATFDGELSSDFPVTLKGYGGDGVFEFVLGDGRAILEVQVFDGEIRLLQAGGGGGGENENREAPGGAVEER